MRRTTATAVLALVLGAALTGCAQAGGPAAADTAGRAPSDPVGAPMPLTRLPMVVVHGTGAQPSAAGRAAGNAELAAQQVPREHDGFEALVEAYRRQHPDRFVAAGRNDAGTLHWITITGRPDAALLAAVRALPFDVTVRTDAPASGATLRAWADRGAAAIAHAPGVAGAAAVVDASSGTIEIGWTRSGAVDPAALRTAATAAATRAAGGRLPVPITVGALPAATG